MGPTRRPKTLVNNHKNTPHKHPGKPTQFYFYFTFTWFNKVRQHKAHAADPTKPEPNAFKSDADTEQYRGYQSIGTDHSLSFTTESNYTAATGISKSTLGLYFLFQMRRP